MRVIPGRAARLLGFADTGTEEWFKLRAGRMTGSRIAAAMGLSPWTSPFVLYWQLLGVTPESTDVKDAPWLQWGGRLEEPIARYWASMHPEVKLRRRKTVWQNKARPWQVCSPDGLILTQGTGSPRRPSGAVLEVKTSRYDDEWGEQDTDEIPVWYRCQALWMLDTLQMEWCHFAVLFGGSDYREYRVRYHEDDVALLRARGEEFLEMVRTRQRPDIDAHSSTYQLIRSFHPDIDGSTIDLPADLAEQIRIAKAEMREAEDTLATVRSTLAELMGSSKQAKFDGRKYADRRSKNGGTPYVQFADLEARSVLSDRKATE